MGGGGIRCAKWILSANQYLRLEGPGIFVTSVGLFISDNARVGGEGSFQIRHGARCGSDAVYVWYD